ncbi:MAG: four-carbon acid sugar kinase family protein [Bryobacterales bacterium]|nr:four-carbon acid sugar kinase family protein [Bryobacterales bacterium]
MNLALAFYGDDFTGSTDAMEALARNGMPTVLFLDTPTASQLARFPEARAVGVAGISRSQSPEWMEEHLPPVFERLKEFRPAICHYKVCSTFDSSPAIGSIGRALDIGMRVFGNPWAPLVVGAPVLKRYTLFGNLFAAIHGVAYRIDRHPTMSRHPVTPMDEADLRLHLSAQTDKRIDLVDILALQSANPEARLREVLDRSPDVVLFDILDEDSLARAGELIWTHRPSGTMFAVGSSGFEYALVEWWRRNGEILDPPPVFGHGKPERVAVVSGSCSPVTESQIRWALANGFKGVALDIPRLVGADGDLEFRHAVASGVTALDEGRSVVLYSALGGEGLVTTGDKVELGGRIGHQLGRILGELRARTGIARMMVAGGDTSGHAAQKLRIPAVTMVRPIAPGGPLCRAHADDPSMDGIEIVFKGGQVGTERYFGQVRDGV